MGAGASQTLRSGHSDSRVVSIRQDGSENLSGPGNSTFTLRFHMQDHDLNERQLQSQTSDTESLVRKSRARSLPLPSGAISLESLDETHEDENRRSSLPSAIEDNNNSKSPRPNPSPLSPISSILEPQVEDDPDLQKYSDEVFEEDTIEWKRAETLGSGSYGTVFLARDEHTGSLMAVKEILIEDEHERDIQTTNREVHVLKTLQHENVVKYLGSQLDKESKRLYIFTEWVPGGNLEQNRKRFGSNERVIRRFTRQIVQGVAYLHAQNVIHHDIKPSNLLVDQFGVVKLADFGASRLISANGSTMINNESMRGTPNYMAPEVIRQTGRGRKSDIWSIGCSVLRLLTGHAPWSDKKFDSQIALLYYIAHLDELPPLPADDIAVLSEDAQSFIMTCLQIDPHKRPSAQELLHHPFINTSCISPTVSPTRPSPIVDSKCQVVNFSTQISVNTQFSSSKVSPPSIRKAVDSPKSKAVETKSHLPFHSRNEQDETSLSIRTNSHARIKPLPSRSELPPLRTGSKTSSIKASSEIGDSIEIGTSMDDIRDSLVQDLPSTATGTSTFRWEEQPIITDAARLERERRQAQAAEEQAKRHERDRKFREEMLEFRREQSSQSTLLL